MEKFFSLPSEKVKILRSRGVSIPNDGIQKDLLSKRNYYNLVNGYKDPFLINRIGSPEVYRAGTQLQELESLLKFDSNLRLLFLREILKLEEIFKNQVVQSFYTYHLYQNNQHSKEEIKNLHRDSEYLRRKYYDLTPLYTEHSNDSFGVISTTITTTRPRNRCTTWDRQSTYDKYIATVYQTLGQQRKNKNQSIKAYLEQHGYMPMWVLMNVLTFGNVSHLFTLQKKEVQLNIIRDMNLITLPQISHEAAIVNTSRIIQILSIYRNICAHNERFYNTEIKVPIDDAFMGFGKKLPNYVQPGGRIRLNQAQRNKRLNARKGIYVLIFIISLFMDKKELNGFVNEILNEFKVLKKSLHSDTYDEVVRLMGLNFDWYELIKNN